MRKKEGFSIIELMAVIMILGIVLAITIPRFRKAGRVQRQKVLADIGDPNTVEVAIVWQRFGGQVITVKKETGETYTYDITNNRIETDDIEALGFVAKEKDGLGRQVWVRKPPDTVPEE